MHISALYLYALHMGVCNTCVLLNWSLWPSLPPVPQKFLAHVSCQPVRQAHKGQGWVGWIWTCDYCVEAAGDTVCVDCGYQGSMGL